MVNEVRLVIDSSWRGQLPLASLVIDSSWRGQLPLASLVIDSSWRGQLPLASLVIDGSWRGQLPLASLVIDSSWGGQLPLASLVIDSSWRGPTATRFLGHRQFFGEGDRHLHPWSSTVLGGGHHCSFLLTALEKALCLDILHHQHSGLLLYQQLKHCL